VRIAIWSPRMTGYSGVELYTFELALALRRARHDVSVHAPTWDDHLRLPLLAARVACLDFDHFDDGIQVNIAPKFGAYRAASVTNRPIIQVLHSEHLTDVPMKTPYRPVGVVMIRRGQSFLLDIDEETSGVRRKVIRNPINFGRFGPGETPLAAREFEGVMLSEFDDMKAELAAEFQRIVFGPVLLVGPWHSELPVPPGCRHEQPTMDTRAAYARARVAFSYRLSRQFTEAMLCGLPVLVRGQLEAPIATRHDREGEWTRFEPTDAARAITFEFDADRVAQDMVAFAVECLA
jgi:hypothetical protein